MNNEFSKEEIKDSVECRWRIFHIKQTLFIYLLIVIGSFLVCMISPFVNGWQYFGVSMITWGACTLFLGVVFGIFIIYYAARYRYIVKNYTDFACYEVLLDRFSVSSSYKNAITYTVTFVHNGEKKQIDTNSCFFNDILEEFHNKKVLGLYDERLDKFYIIKKSKE